MRRDTDQSDPLTDYELNIVESLSKEWKFGDIYLTSWRLAVNEVMGNYLPRLVVEVRRLRVEAEKPE